MTVGPGGQARPLMPGCTGDARLHIDRVTALHYLVRSVGLLWWLLHKMELVVMQGWISLWRAGQLGTQDGEVRWTPTTMTRTS